MNKMLWDEFDVDIPVEWPSNHTTCIILNNYPSDSAFDILETKKTETINDILTASFIQSIDSVNAWISANDNAEPLWYKFKNTHLQHLARIIPFSYFQIPIGGYKGIVNATAENWGASWRMIVELGDEINAWGIYPGGQSGNPGSPAYNSYTEDWTKGEYFKIKFMGEFGEEGDGLVNILLTKEQEDE